MEEKKNRVFSTNLNMDDVKRMMNLIDPKKDSKYFKQVWDDIDKYEKRHDELVEKENQKK